MTAYYFGPTAAELVTSLLLTSPKHLRQEPYFYFEQVKDDPDDNKFVDCAIAAGADWLVSDDRHILNLNNEKNRFPSVPICSFVEFRRLIG